MNYCLSAQVDKKYLEKVQEIRIKYRNLDTLLDLYEINPKASIIITLPSKEDKTKIRWSDIQNYNTMWQNKIIIETDSFDIMDACKMLGIKYFYAIPISTFAELKALVDCGCCDVKIDAPLTHMLDKLDNYDITLRMSPNIAYYAHIPRVDGVIGSWVRPEDVELYEEYIDVFEFEDCDKAKEEALYRVYAEQKNWPSNLNNLITNLDYNATGKLVLPEFATARTFCGQKCLTGIHCDLCYKFLNLASIDKIQSLDKIK